MAARRTVTKLGHHKTWKPWQGPGMKPPEASIFSSPEPKGQTTGLTGLRVVDNPHVYLNELYQKLAKVLSNMPQHAAYRQNTEPIIKHRHSLVLSEPDPQKLEQKIADGQIEEVIRQAQRELQLARRVLDERVWEPLIDEGPKDQWKWPPS